MKAWPLLCALLAGLCLGAWALAGAAPGGAHPLAWDASLWLRRPWTLWTASLLHLTSWHLLANLAALAALAVLGWLLHAARAQVAALLLAWPLGNLALAFWPEVRQYAGLSGLLHAAAMVLWAQAAVQRRGFSMASLLLPAMALKLVAEHAWSQPMGFDPAWGFTVVYAAHLSGAAAGMACGLLCAAAERLLDGRCAAAGG